MKGRIIFAAMLICACVSACEKKAPIEDDEPVEVDTYESFTDSEKEIDPEVEANNGALIAKALGIEENHRKIQFILRALDTVNSGKISDAKRIDADNGVDLYLDVVAEDGSNLRIELSKSYSLEGVQNLDTQEWLITSEE